MKRFALLMPLCLAGCLMYEERSYRQVPASEPVSALKVVAMKQGGVSEEAIISRIQSNGINRQQNADDLIMMKSSGASDAVISAMISAPVMPTRQARNYGEGNTYYYDHGTSEATSFWMGALLGSWWRPWRYRCH